MKLALVVLLVTLACCCSSVSSDMCDPVDEHLRAMLYKGKEEFKKIVKKYADDENGIKASLKIKKCADKLSSDEKNAYFEMAKNIMAECKKSWKEE